MPIHDWTRVDSGIFHHFQVTWIGELSAALNNGVLPQGFFALAEQVVSGPVPDVVTLQFSDPRHATPGKVGGIAVAEEAPFCQHGTSRSLCGKGESHRDSPSMGKGCGGDRTCFTRKQREPASPALDFVGSALRTVFSGV
jgi:hypothetical protein